MQATRACSTRWPIFYEFGSDPQGLRVIAKLQSDADSHGLNLTKTSIATYLKYLRMAGTTPGVMPNGAPERFTEKAGFFSTEAGLVKNVWSEITSDTAEPQRFPPTYIVAAAEDIVTTLNDLEDAIDAGGSRQAFSEIKKIWSDTKIAEPGAFDDAIRACICSAEDQQDETKDVGFGEARATLIELFSNAAASCYMDMHQEVFAGTPATLLPAASATGTALAIFKAYAKKHAQRRPAAQHRELAGYATVYGLLEHFGKLLACSTPRFQAAMGAAEQDEQGHPIFFEKKLLALIPAEYLQSYSYVVQQIGNAGGRDAEFEEWNARAHLVVDFLAGLTEALAQALFQTLSGTHR